MALGGGHVRESEFEISFPYVPQPRKHREHEKRDRGAHRPRKGTRQPSEHLDEDPNRRVFKPSNHELGSTVASKVFDVNEVRCTIRVEAVLMRLRSAVVLILFSSSCFLAAQSFDAKQQFKQKCAMCHGADGKTPSILGKNLGSPDLSSDKVQKMSDKDLREVLLHGKDRMPAYEKSLGEKNIDEMVKYVRGIKK